MPVRVLASFPVRAIAFALAVLVLFAVDLSAANKLMWNNRANQVSAEIDSWPLSTFLEKLTDVTGWQVYVQPDTTTAVSAKFKNRTPGEALQILLGDLNFALLPESSGSSRLLVFRTAREDATQLIRSSGATNLIRNELIVTLKPGENIDDLAKKLGAKVVGRSDSLHAYRLQFDDEASARKARESLNQNSGVASVENNYSVNRSPNSGLVNAKGATSVQLNAKALGGGNPIIVGLIDTTTQSLGKTLDAFMLPSESVAGKVTPPEGEPTHGTVMAESILRGVQMGMSEGASSTVRVLPVNVYPDTTGSTTAFEIAMGIETAVNKGANIINMSLGGTGSSDLVQKVITDASGKGVLFLGAAGNDPSIEPVYPAAYNGVVAVTARDSTGGIAAYANHGDFVAIALPDQAAVNFGASQYVFTGTSVSTAYASGIAAGVADKNHANMETVKNAILKSLAVKK